MMEEAFQLTRARHRASADRLLPWVLPAYILHPD